MTGGTEDLDALFDEVAAQRSEGASEPEATPVAASPAPAAGTEPKVVTDNPLFDGLGNIVRQLHDSMKQLGLDQTLAERVGEIADSKGRLQHIADLTEQAANRVLNAVDASMPEQDLLASTAKDVEGRWALALKGKLSIEEFQSLAGDSKNFASLVASSAEAEKARLLEIMMSQDFQDITGQIIKKVIGISQKLESDLAQLLREHAPANIHKEVDLMAGPDVPAKAMAQDDVDSLLADLGF